MICDFDISQTSCFEKFRAVLSTAPCMVRAWSLIKHRTHCLIKIACYPTAKILIKIVSFLQNLHIRDGNNWMIKPVI
jgi:hypothetical protein